MKMCEDGGMGAKEKMGHMEHGKKAAHHMKKKAKKKVAKKK